MENYIVNDRVFPVLEVLSVGGKPIPLLSIKMMSDERERELGRKEAVPV